MPKQYLQYGGASSSIFKNYPSYYYTQESKSEQAKLRENPWQPVIPRRPYVRGGSNLGGSTSYS